MDNDFDLIRWLEETIAELPAGYISRKNIREKTQYYLQWKEAGKLKSKYLRESEVEDVRERIERRKRLQARLKELRGTLPDGSGAPFQSHVVTGKMLRSMTGIVVGFEKRDIYEQLPRYLYGPEDTRVFIVYGLRRTGKTTMLFQAISEMSAGDFAKTAYIKARRSDTVAMVKRDLDRLFQAGFRFVFIDEATLMKDFIDSAALFSDVYVPMGMKIVLSGTDSLSFWVARDNELYDRERTIHTTFIPYREYSRLLGIDSIDAYIRYGGTLRAGEIDFEDVDLNAEDASFRDDESTRRYIDTAICKNIQRSLECFEDGNHFRHLYSLYEAGELTGAINRIIKDMNHRFVLNVLTRDFKSAGLGITARNLRKERDPAKRTDILDRVDAAAVTKRLMELLEIRDREDQSVGVTSAHITEIREYLTALDLIMDCPNESAVPGTGSQEHILFTQPGMRYCQAQALVYALAKDDVFQLLNAAERRSVAERLLEEVRGRMLEDIVILETAKALDRSRYRVFKFEAAAWEYDMVVYDRESHCCHAYEIKHSREAVPEQARHLRNAEKRALLEQRFGKATARTVLYLGEPLDLEDGVSYRNAEAFLKHLPELEPTPVLDEIQEQHRAPFLSM